MKTKLPYILILAYAFSPSQSSNGAYTVQGFNIKKETHIDTLYNCYKNGSLRGMLIEINDSTYLQKKYYHFGMIAEQCSYLNGYKHYASTSYFENGTISSKAEYKQGVITGTRETFYYPNGELYRRSQWKDSFLFISKFRKDGSLYSIDTILITPESNYLYTPIELSLESYSKNKCLSKHD